MRVVALAALLLALPAFAQKYDETITVNVVDVPVYVERFGVPIKGLTRDNFKLFVDGKPHPIDSFEVIEQRGGAPVGPEKTRADRRRRRLVVLLFDISSSPQSLRRAREAAIEYVAKGGPGDTFAVATVGRSTLRFIAAFTNDRVAVQRAIATLAGVILNAVDIHPPKAPATNADIRGRSRFEHVFASQFLYTLALDTGGAVATSLPHLLERGSVAYVLGFQTRPRATSGSIRVEVKNLPLLADVRYRKSFDLAAEKTGDRGLLLADTILNDIPQNGVTLDLGVKGTEVTASIPGVELLSYSSDKPLYLEVFFYVFNGEGRPFSWNVLQIAVDLEKGREFLSANPYSMRQELVLAPGRYVVKALVRIAGTDRVGFRRAEVVVPPS